MAGVAPGLSGVSETMLWSLHNRACEARRRDGILKDAQAIAIHDAIDYDFNRHFGTPTGSLAARAAEIDRVLCAWLAENPDGTVVSLGEGLETQAGRVDNGRMNWLSVDLEPAMALRERFIRPTPRFRHLAASALSPGWMDEVDPSSGVCIIAQGLLMYLPPDLVKTLFCAIAQKFVGGVMVFDSVPHWFSRLTLQGLQQTPHYRLPPMPWGIDRDEIETTLRSWQPGISSVEFLDYRAPRGWHRFASHWVGKIPVFRHELPSLVRITL